MITKTCNVIILPTDEKAYSNLVLDKDNQLRYLVGSIKANPAFKPQYLYITSNEGSIQKGDWFYHSIGGIYQCLGVTVNGDIQFQGPLIVNSYPKGALDQYIKKIIASTDSSIIKDWDKIESDNLDAKAFTLPQIPQSFISLYIEEYNARRPITKVEVEYDFVWHNEGKSDMWTEGDTHPKIIDNTVSIKPLKTSWNREEVQTLINSFADLYNINWLDYKTQTWIKENL